MTWPTEFEGTEFVLPDVLCLTEQWNVIRCFGNITSDVEQKYTEGEQDNDSYLHFLSRSAEKYRQQ